MAKVERLTVGILTRNGEAQLGKCLGSLPALVDCADSVEFILVDSASADATLEIMSTFAANRTDTRVYSMEGEVNASAARNVILNHANAGAVFLVDGDVAINREFVVTALAEFEAGNAEICYGQLPEVWHTADHVPYAEVGDRYSASTRKYMPHHMGVVLLAQEVLVGGNRYNEALRRYEDVDFSIRAAERYRILALPVVMGTHYTINYHSASRVMVFYSDAYMRPVGQFIRQNLFKPGRLWRARVGYSGNIIGLVEQLVFIIGLITGSSNLILLSLLVFGIEFSRFYLQGRANKFIPIRIVGAWQILYGFLFPEGLRVDYEVREVSANLNELHEFNT